MQNENDEKPSTAPTGGATPAADQTLHEHGGARIIQPLAGGVVDDPPPPTPPGPPKPPAAPPPPPSDPSATTVSTPSTDSIYPQATHGIDETELQTPPAAATDKFVTNQADKRAQLLLVGVWIIGALIVGGPLISLILIPRITGTSLGAVSIIFNVPYLLIGIGVLARRDLARIVYVVLAVIGLIFSVIGTFSYVGYIHTVSSTQASDAAKARNTIVQTENDKSLSAAERQRIVQGIQQNLALEKKDDQEREVRLLNLIPDYLIALVPLIFLTRPSIKELFD